MPRKASGFLLGVKYDKNELHCAHVFCASLSCGPTILQLQKWHPSSASPLPHSRQVGCEQWPFLWRPQPSHLLPLQQLPDALICLITLIAGHRCGGWPGGWLWRAQITWGAPEPSPARSVHNPMLIITSRAPEQLELLGRKERCGREPCFRAQKHRVIWAPTLSPSYPAEHGPHACSLRCMCIQIAARGEGRRRGWVECKGGGRQQHGGGHQRVLCTQQQAMEHSTDPCSPECTILRRGYFHLLASSYWPHNGHRMAWGKAEVMRLPPHAAPPPQLHRDLTLI